MGPWRRERFSEAETRVAPKSARAVADQNFKIQGSGDHDEAIAAGLNAKMNLGMWRGSVSIQQAESCRTYVHEVWASANMLDLPLTNRVSPQDGAGVGLWQECVLCSKKCEPNQRDPSIYRLERHGVTTFCAKENLCPRCFLSDILVFGVPFKASFSMQGFRDLLPLSRSLAFCLFSFLVLSPSLPLPVALPLPLSLPPLSPLSSPSSLVLSSLSSLVLSSLPPSLSLSLSLSRSRSRSRSFLLSHSIN